MSIKFRVKEPDSVVRTIAAALDDYAAAHPHAQIEVYRQNSVSVRIRVLSSEFEKIARAERENGIWDALDRLPEDVTSEVSMLLLLTPQEAKKSLANMEFDDPIPSQI